MKKNVNTGVYIKNGEEIKFDYFTSLRAEDKMRFVNSVTNLLVGDNYNSVLRNLVFDYMIIDIFTDVDISEIQNSESGSIKLIEDLLDETNIVEIVKANVDNGLIEELNNAVNDNIEYRTGIHKNPIAESLSHLIGVLERKISETDVESMMKMAKAISKISGELTADKILESYSKSDVFKERYKQIAENRKGNDIEAATVEDSFDNER